LGVDEWNIYGISYGTRLALTVMRDHPAGVRSVVLDSTYPPAADLVAELVPNGRRALNKLFEGCASNATCSEFAPDLETMFWDTVAQLDAEPALVSVAHPYRGDSYDFLLDGYALIEMTFNSLYNAADIAHLPYLIWSASRGKYYIVAKQAIQYRVLGEFISDGMYYSVECNEEYPFFTPGPEPDPDDPLADIDAITADVCAEWQAVTPDPVENEPVVSDIPTLVLAGEYDPITPPAWGQLAAETLSSSYFFEYPGLAHGVTRDHFCPLGMMLTFLDDPATAPDASCIEEMDGPAFVRY
jgi:pimeloyl-ACP methyl ester carboxylesterase